MSPSMWIGRETSCCFLIFWERKAMPFIKASKMRSIKTCSIKQWRNFPAESGDRADAFGILPETTERTQKEVADILGISQSYISRLEKKIMGRLKKEMNKLM